MKVHTRTSGSDSPVGTLLFWREDRYHNVLVKGQAANQLQPYGVAEMNRSIDYFHNDGSETFSTGLRYDVDGLHATGYAPSDALSPSTYTVLGATDYTRLTVKEEYQKGLTDFCTATATTVTKAR